MIQTINFANYKEEMEKFADRDDFLDFLKRYGCDGIELMYCEPLENGYLTADMIQGVHLPAFNTWIDFWNGDMDSVIREYGSMETAVQYYGGADRQALLDLYRKKLDFAESVHAHYVVFHICDIGIEESFRYQFLHTDEQVIDASIDFVNQLLNGREYSFDFLMENLWWPGLNYKNPELAERLLEGIHYSKKGLMLDTGHLLNTNTELKNADEGVAYILKVLEENQAVIPWIKGIHLCESLSGALVKDMLTKEVVLKEDFWERWSQVYSYIFQIDQHRPISTASYGKVIDRIEPKYITHELITTGREHLDQVMEQQIGYLKKFT